MRAESVSKTSEMMIARVSTKKYLIFNVHPSVHPFLFEQFGGLLLLYVCDGLLAVVFVQKKS